MSSARSTHRRSTAGPVSTSPSWSAPCAPCPTWTPACAASARRAPRPGTTGLRRARVAGRGQRRDPHPRRRPGDGRRLRREPTSCTRTPGTPTWPATSPACMHGIPHVVSAHSLEPMRPWKAEQLGGGYALSSWAERTAYEGAAAIIAVSAAMRDDVLRSYPDVDPDRVHVVHNGIDTTQWSPISQPRPGPRARRRPRPAERDLRRPDHPPEGPAALPPRRRGAAPRGAARAVRRRPGHPGDRGRGARTGRGPGRDPLRRRVDRRDAAAPRRRRAADRRHRLRLPVDLRAARHRQPRGDGLRDRRRRHRHRAASPRSSSTARPAGWCRSSRPPTAPAPPSTPSATSPTSAPP